MKKRGFGIASIYYGIGNTGLPNPASVFLEVLEDGSVCVLCGASDMGQGSSTTLAQIVATGLGVPVETVRVTTADSDVTPDAGVSSGTRQTYVSGNAACVAASQAGRSSARSPPKNSSTTFRSMRSAPKKAWCFPITTGTLPCRFGTWLLPAGRRDSSSWAAGA